MPKTYLQMTAQEKRQAVLDLLNREGTIDPAHGKSGLVFSEIKRRLDATQSLSSVLNIMARRGEIEKGERVTGNQIKWIALVTEAKPVRYGPLPGRTPARKRPAPPGPGLPPRGQKLRQTQHQPRRTMRPHPLRQPAVQRVWIGGGGMNTHKPDCTPFAWHYYGECSGGFFADAIRRQPPYLFENDIKAFDRISITPLYTEPDLLDAIDKAYQRGLEAGQKLAQDADHKPEVHSQA